MDKIAGIKPIDLGVSPNWRESKRDREKDGKMEVRGKNAGRLTKPTTDKAKLWNGYKSHGLKPAYEPIIVAMKPNEGSYAENALKHSVAGLNIDGGRIGTEELSYTSTFKRMIKKNIEQGYRPTAMEGSGGEIKKTVKGRYPANIILNQEAGQLLDEQSGELKSGAMKKPYKYTNTGHSLGKPAGETKQIHESNRGGASRFFYCAKSSKSERNAGLSGNKQKRDRSRSHGQAGTDNPYNRGAQEVTNHHPTVKPLALLKYLLTLLKTPTGGICLDCFAGSGGTLVACENMGINYIGIELNQEYCEIAKQRITREIQQTKMF